MVFQRKAPKKVIGNKAYDSDLLDRALAEFDVEMIAPHRKNRVNKTQDGRKLRSYSLRWIIEDCNNRLQRYRKVLVKYELHFKNFKGFVYLATLGIIMQHLFRKGFL